MGNLALWLKNVSTLSEVTRRSELDDRVKVECRVSFDRAVSREPLAIAADAAHLDFECCFGTSVPSFCGAPVVFGKEPAKHGDDLTPDTRCEAIMMSGRMQVRTLAYA